MNLPKIEGYKLRGVLGTGSCGTVYLGERAEGGMYAIKLLASLAVNRDVLGLSFVRIGRKARPATILDVIEYDLVGSPQFIAMPFLGEFGTNGVPVSASFGSLCGSIPESEAWEVLGKIASGMAFLHREGVAHCNLSPSNILYVKEQGRLEPRIVDISLGWLGGVHRMDLDPLLPYLAPEQAITPDDFFEGAGLRWDVYAFGVLAYELITGRLPRIAGYAKRVRDQQDPHGVGLPFVLDAEDFLLKVEEEQDIQWPWQAASHGDARRRKVIEECLRIDPQKRWVDLREVEREFVTVENEALSAQLDSKARHEKRRQRDKLVKTRIFSISACFGMVAAGGYGVHLANELAAEREQRVIEESRLRDIIAERDQKLARLRGELEEAQQSFKQARDQTDGLIVSFLDSSEEIERILEGRQLEGALDFYEQRVAAAAAETITAVSIQDFYNLALLRRRSGNLEGALQAFRGVQQQLVELGKTSPEAAGRGELLVKAARAGFEEYKLLQKTAGSANAVDALQRSRDFYRQLAHKDTTNKDLLREAAAVSLHLGRQLRQASRYETAAEALLEAFTFLGDASPDPISDPGVLGSVARQSRYELGLLRRLQGELPAAVALQLEIVEGCMPHVEAGALSFEDKRLLAFAYTELAEMVSVVTGPQDGVEAHGQAAALLKELLAEKPDDVPVRYALARNYTELAAYDRDTGDRKESLRKQQLGVEIFEQLLGEAPALGGHMRIVRLECAEQGIVLVELLGEADRSREAIEVGEQTLASLEKLYGELSGSDTEPHGQLRGRVGLALARLFGSLGHNHEKLGDTAAARKCFMRAVDHWKTLAKAAQPGTSSVADEIERGLTWSQDRLAKIQR